MNEVYEGSRLAEAADLEIVDRLLKMASTDASTKRGGELLLDRELSDQGDRILAYLRDGPPGVGPDAADLDIIVGEFSSCVFGVAVVVYETLASDRQLARLSTFVVEEGARGVGIGAAMMGHVRELARARGCVSLDANALPGDRNTKNFFESFGMKARLLTVNAEL